MSDPWQEVGDRIYRRRYESLSLNIGLVLCDGAAVVIDSRAHHGQADDLRAEIEQKTRLPVTTLINTHFHWDHTFGNARFPEATIVGHVRCRSALLERGAEMKRDLLEADWMPAQAKPDIADVDIVPPEVTFQQSLELSIGGRVLELHYLGRAHTDSDIVIGVEGVCFAGDLVEESAPPAFGDSFPLEWAATLDALVPLIRGPVVPGHGDVVDGAFVASQREEIDEAVRAAQEGGSGPYPASVIESIRQRIDVTD
jgi:glyoxylase-like metal-dependent hydrolase (beta-lactamase superfamily II)